MKNQKHCCYILFSFGCRHLTKSNQAEAFGVEPLILISSLSHNVWPSLCSFVGQVITLILRFQVAVIPCCAVISVSFGFYFSLEPTPKPRPLTQLPPVEPDPSPVPPDHEPSSVPPDHEDHEASVLFLERLWNSAGFVIFCFFYYFLLDELLVVTMNNG